MRISPFFFPTAMKWIRQLVGWLAMILGVAGVAACLAGLVGVWVLNQRIQRPTQEILDQVVTLCVQGADGADAIAEEIESSREGARAIQDLLQTKIREAFDLSEEDIEQIEALYTDLQFVIQRVRDWILLAGTALDFVDQLVDITASTIGYVQADSSVREDLASALAGGGRKVEEAAGLLDEIHRQILTLQNPDDTDVELQKIETLSSRIDGALLHLKEQTLLFSAEILGLAEAAERLHMRIKRLILLCAIALTFLLLWQTAAQAALVLLGRRMIRPKPAPFAQKPPPETPQAPKSIPTGI